jgi:tRNA 2-thiouridine synthesizing protein E
MNNNQSEFGDLPVVDNQPLVCFDEDGFMLEPANWTEGTASMIAEIDGVGSLRTEHWRAIHFLRDRYLRLGAIPPVRNICRNSTLSKEEIKKLFGSCLEIWRIAGLPNPGEEARSYMT